MQRRWRTTWPGQHLPLHAYLYRNRRQPNSRHGAPMLQLVLLLLAGFAVADVVVAVAAAVFAVVVSVVLATVVAVIAAVAAAVAFVAAAVGYCCCRCC